MTTSPKRTEHDQPHFDWHGFCKCMGSCCYDNETPDADRMCHCLGCICVDSDHS